MSNPHPACGGCCTRLKSLSVTIGRQSILQEISLHVHCGELTFFIGANGAGKTTLFRAILGEIPYRGELQFTHRDNATKFEKPRIGYVPQRLTIDPHAPLTVAEFLECSRPLPAMWLLNAKRRRSATVEQAIEAVGVEGLLTRQLGRLSGGELQRVLLTMALIPKPHLLLLDEPASNLDHKASMQLYELVSTLRTKFDVAVLLVSHDLPAVARFADRVILLNKTILADGHPDTVLRLPEVTDIFGFTVPAAEKQLLASDRHEQIA